jgi:hypothetical protein
MIIHNTKNKKIVTNKPKYLNRMDLWLPKEIWLWLTRECGFQSILEKPLHWFFQIWYGFWIIHLSTRKKK